MAFRTADFKKTTRTSGGERVLYPYQIRDDRYTAAIGYAIAYYERMVGRRRAEFEAETLLEFFGEPKLARGLVACLARTYAWREQTFDEAFGEETAKALWRTGIIRPADLRARLYGLANGRYGGVILPHERAEAIAFLCNQLATESTENPENKTHIPLANSVDSVASVAKTSVLTPEQFERGLTLDTEDQQVLVKIGAMPTPQEIVARYNYHSLETALCHAETLRLRLRGPVWNIVRTVHNLARRYNIRYQINTPRTLFEEQVEVTLLGAKDALGSWLRAGRRVARALLRLIATHPASLVAGEALVHIAGKSSVLRLDERAFAALGIADNEEPQESDPWEEQVIERFRQAWSRQYVKGRTAGWRLRRDPEPLVGAGALVIPDFTLQRGNERVALCLATGRATAEALARDLGQLGRNTGALVVAPEHIAEALPRCPVPLATYHEQPPEAVPALIRTLERRYPRGAAAKTLTPWQQLEQQVVEEGFVNEEQVAALLHCTPAEAVTAVRRWGGAGLHVLPGLGVCSPDALGDLRHLLEQGALTQSAA
jgi:predicted nuclease of restriction endonuclease-like RecB superfamily